MRYRAARLEPVVIVGDRRQRLRGLVVDHAGVDALVQADLEAARSDLVYAGFPLLARLAEEVIVQKVDVLRPRARRARLMRWC
jgi:hypothetical protein